MKKLQFLALLLTLVAGTATALYFLVEAELTIEAVSNQQIEDRGWTGPNSNGLRVVGVGELVYLSAAEAGGAAVTSYAWSLTGPSGSTATLDSVGTEWNTFRPDTTGVFTVEVTVNTASGSSSATQTVTAATYVGNGSLGGATPNASAGQCGACHTRETASWLGTRHASKFARDIDGAVSSYSTSCLRCHTVGFNDDPEADNGGFDDVAASLGWTIPTTLQPGNWDAMLAQYPKLAQLANIQCENCHGAGSLHMGNRAAIAFSAEEGVCFKCHDDRPYHAKGTQWRASSMPSSIEELRAGGNDGGHARGIASASNNSSNSYPAAEGFSCNGCHSAYGFIKRTDPASNLRTASGDPLITGKAQTSCATCHDPHSAENHHQLRRAADVTLMDGTVITWGEEGKLCMNCHKARENAETYVAVEGRSRFRGPHYGPQADMLAGTNAITFGRILPNTTHKDVLDEACVSCHMYETPAQGEPGHNLLGGHSWNMSIAQVVGTDTLEVNHVARCRTCHEPDMETFADRKVRKDYDGDGEIEGAQEEIHGLMEKLAMALPPIGEPEIDYSTDFTKVQRGALYNYLYVEEDQSAGMHNFQFAANLLLLSIEAATYGVLSEGTITRIEDVPNDQGKQVFVAWNRFGGDGVSDDPLQTYYVWRRLDAESMGKSGPTFSSFEKVPGDADKVEPGMTVASGGEVWMQVASHVAAGMDLYAATAPTLFDATAGDTVWTVFRVSGHSADAQVFVVSAPDSGYSVDNLAPMAPMGVSAAILGPTVSLTWEEAKDVDFEHFEIYRSEQPGFLPTSAEFIGKVGSPAFRDWGIENGKTYYYRVAAFDFAGNRGAFSEEVSLVVAVGVDDEGVPTEFALKQNYPNPFNPTTTIAFDLPAATQVRVSILDVSGREIDVLVDRQMPAGRYHVPWTAEGAASGVYLYRLRTKDFVDVKTMILVK